MNENNNTQNLPMEFKILEFRSAGFLGTAGTAWFHGEDNLGRDEELEDILNDFGNQGWDIVQLIPSLNVAVPTRIFLRRKAR